MGVGLQLPDLLNNLGFDTIIHRSNNVVNGGNMLPFKGTEKRKI